MGLLYLGAWARERFDTDVRIVDQRLENCSTGELATQAAEFDADIIGLSCATPSAFLLPDVTKKMRQALPNALITIGGPHASAYREQAFDDIEADVAVSGEGELTFERVIQAFSDGGREEGAYGDIPGLIWREPGGEIVVNPGTLPFIEDMDTLPMPAYDLIEMERYWPMASFVLVPRRRYISLMTSRGCPFQCNFCHKVFGKRFRGHSPERVVDEIEYFTKKYGIDDVEFMDDVFNYDYDRAIEICELIQKRNLRIRLALPNGVRTDSLSEEVIEVLADTGLYFCSVALESGSPRIQKLMGKNLNIPSFIENVALAAKHGIFMNGFAMLGFPTETEDEIKQTIDIMCNSKLHTAQFHAVTPFPGSPLFDEILENQPEVIEGIDFKNSTVFTISVNLSDVPDDVLFGHRSRAYRRFYMNPIRALRVLRDHPRPLSVAYYVPMFLERSTQGLFGGKEDAH